MKRLLLLAAIAALAVVSPARAGDEEPCTMSTDACVATMVDKIRHKGWVGIILDVVDGRKRIEKVIPGSPGEKAGLKAGDVLLEVDGLAYTEANRAALDRAYKAMTPGKRITYTLERGGERLEVPIILGRVPEEMLAQWVGEHVVKHHAHTVAVASSGGG